MSLQSKYQKKENDFVIFEDKLQQTIIYPLLL